MFFIDKNGKLQFNDSNTKQNDKEYYKALWREKYNIRFKEKKLDIMNFINGKTKSVY